MKYNYNEAIAQLSTLMDSNPSSIIDSLVGVLFDEEEAGELKQMLDS